MQTFLRLEITFFFSKKFSHQNPKNVLTDGICVILFVQMIRRGDATTVPGCHYSHIMQLNFARKSFFGHTGSFDFKFLTENRTQKFKVKITNVKFWPKYTLYEKCTFMENRSFYLKINMRVTIIFDNKFFSNLITLVSFCKDARQALN